MSPAALITAAFLLALGGLAFGWRLGIDHEKANRLDDAATMAAMEQTVAEAIAAKMPAQQKIIERVTRETVQTPVYAECHHTPSGLRDINAILSGSDPVAVPDTDAP